MYIYIHFFMVKPCLFFMVEALEALRGDLHEAEQLAETRRQAQRPNLVPNVTGK